MDAISCFAPPALLSHSFADAAIARALTISVSDSTAAPPSPLGELLGGSGVPAAPETPRTPSSGRSRLAPAGGRAGKRRARPSRRAPTTYISTDAANFPLMVQRITGAQAADPLALDAPALLAGAAAARGSFAALPPPAANGAAEQPCFPTLDSWSVMYEKSEML